jgi:5-methylcytosine-specific restriction protein B
MKLNPVKADELWTSFVQRWPLEKLNELTLEQYTQVLGAKGDGDSFTYWLEAKTAEIGSIWGGSSFKFGIYQRSNTDAKANTQGRIFGEKYAWYEKYGATAEAAFAAVKKEVLKVATAARAGRADEIVQADLGPAVKWKIAFLYQPADVPYLLPIFSRDVLGLLAANPSADFPELYKQLLKQRKDVPIFSYAKELWERGEGIKASQDNALAYLTNRFTPLKDPVKYMAGFVTKGGRQLALVRRGQEVTLFVEPGDWESLVPGVVLKKSYSESEPRIHSLGANAPQLYVGHPSLNLLIPSQTVLAEFCDVYDDLEQESLTEKSPSPIHQTSPHPSVSGTSMNKILFGPPGTGKTYKTAQIAVELCNGAANSERKVLMQEYEELRKEGRISFVTFHQSYGYEEFVEGLRPEVKDGQVTYSVRPGIFREVCAAAKRSQLVTPGLSGKSLAERKVFKMSLGVAGSPEGKLAFQDSIANGVILLGWGDNIDFSDCDGQTSIKAKVDEIGGIENPESQARYMSVFKDEVAVGDIVIVSQGNNAFRAIGEVVGTYEFLEAPLGGRYHQSRAVRWIAVFEGNRPVDEIYNRKFMQSALYKLQPEHLKTGALEGLINAQSGVGKQDFVLIIDEINRANISKVFGELITLLEPDKREGEINAVTLKLPYSGTEFSVPANLHVIGTMNTADRSIALLDTALRRRFEFEELVPDSTTLEGPLIDGIDLAKLLTALNDRIEALFDRDHRIGHAFFIGISSLQGLDQVFRRKVIPLLQEYFYENWSNVRRVLNDYGPGEFVIKKDLTPLKADGEEGISDDSRIAYRVNEKKFPVSAYQRIYGEN